MQGTDLKIDRCGGGKIGCLRAVTTVAAKPDH